jgi:ubiquinone/menaquinone biosynthesis C-methylase UbiE
MKNDIFQKFHGITDEKWLEMLIRAGDESYIDGVKMPDFPSLEFQKNSVGGTGPQGLKYEPFQFTNRVKRYAKDCGVNIEPGTNILDFGAGWGRMIRFFFKDLPSENIFGVDTWDIMVNYCNELLPAGNYSVNTPFPPIKFADNTFDIIFSYSVFSHLHYSCAEKWIEEFSRILRPNGILVATTEGLRFLELLNELRENPERRKENEWYGLLVRQFNQPIEKYRKRYLSGEYIYTSCRVENVLDSSFYGDAIIPEKFIRDVFGKYLTVFDFYDNVKLPQAVFVLQKN